VLFEKDYFSAKKRRHPNQDLSDTCPFVYHLRDWE